MWKRSSLKNSEISPFRTTWKHFIAAYGVVCAFDKHTLAYLQIHTHTHIYLFITTWKHFIAAYEVVCAFGKHTLAYIQTYTHISSQCLNRYGDMIIIHTHLHIFPFRTTWKHFIAAYGVVCARSHTHNGAIHTHIHTYKNTHTHVQIRTHTHTVTYAEYYLLFFHSSYANCILFHIIAFPMSIVL